jgi:hypothetical protein
MFMTWATLKLWTEDEEPRIQRCIVAALRRLIESQHVDANDDELAISGKLRKHLYKTKKEVRLAWSIMPEASVFASEDTPKPIGHPYLCFVINTPTYEQYEYHVECKLVRVKRAGKSHDYCKYYVTEGIRRFQDGIYAQSEPPMGTMIGYIQEGDILSLLHVINDKVKAQNLSKINLSGSINEKDVTFLHQSLKRNLIEFKLSHLWADLRSLPR